MKKAVLTDNSRRVLEKRYLRTDNNGNVVETPEDMFYRVASTVAAAEKTYGSAVEVQNMTELFYNMLVDMDFVPNSPTLMNAGRPLGQLSACFVLPVGDSIEEIFDAVKYGALIHKSGGGTGYSFSNIRPAGSTVHSTGKYASGPLSFMEVFNTATKTINQGGTRRGANMGMMRVDHPDILKFIHIKDNLNEMTNFNLSVALTDTFVEAVKNKTTYDLIDPATKEVAGRLDATEVFEQIIDSAWRTGEPGIVFIDRINQYNYLKGIYGEIESTNPCGEQPLLPYEACNLGSINLMNHVTTPSIGSLKGQFDFNKLCDTTRLAVRFLDDVIDVNKFPLPQIAEMARDTRKIGLGVMGLADALLLCGIPYDSDEGVELASEIMATIQEVAHSESERLGRERGFYPAAIKMIEDAGGSENAINLYNIPERYLLTRNAGVTTIAPTGTISIIAGTSSGIEPNFAFAFYRKVMDNERLVEANPILIAALKERNLYSDTLMAKIIDQGTLQHIDEIPDDIKKVFVCAHDITPIRHIRMQAAFQDNLDNAVSKTINFPSTATKEDVRAAYIMAYHHGCKGLTVYRDGSRDTQVLNVDHTKKDEKSEIPATIPASLHGTISPRPRPEVLTGTTRKTQVACGKLYVTVNADQEGLWEVLICNGKSGGCQAQSEATARLISIALRAGVDPEAIIDQLRGIRCQACIRYKDKMDLNVTSCPDAIGRELETYIKNHTEVKHATFTSPPTTSKPEVQQNSKGMKHCPECGAKLEHESGCMVCRECGFSKCG